MSIFSSRALHPIDGPHMRFHALARVVDQKNHGSERKPGTTGLYCMKDMWFLAANYHVTENRMRKKMKFVSNALRIWYYMSYSHRFIINIYDKNGTLLLSHVYKHSGKITNSWLNWPQTKPWPTRSNSGHYMWSTTYRGHANPTYMPYSEHNIRVKKLFMDVIIKKTSVDHKPSWDANRFSVTQEIPHLLQNLTLHTVFTTVRHGAYPQPNTLYWNTSLSKSYETNFQLHFVISIVSKPLAESSHHKCQHTATEPFPYLQMVSV